MWAYLGSNQGPLPCEGSALPLSYTPSRPSLYMGGIPRGRPSTSKETRVRSTVNGDANSMHKLVADLEFTLVLAGAEPVTVAAHLRYDARDPFAVSREL